MTSANDGAHRYRTRAKELRALAEQVEDDDTRKLLLTVADEYEEMAERVSRR
jgi:uncharacterized protein (UPF0216 family)